MGPSRGMSSEQYIQTDGHLFSAARAERAAAPSATDERRPQGSPRGTMAERPRQRAGSASERAGAKQNRKATDKLLKAQ